MQRLFFYGQAMESLMSKNVLPANAKPTQVQLDDQLLAAMKACRKTVQAQPSIETKGCSPICCAL